MIKRIVDNVFVKADAERPYLNMLSRKEGIIVGDENHKSWLRAAKILQEEIKRHCDNHSGLEVDAECHYECSFCGSQVVDKDDYECCDESITEHDQALSPNQTPKG